MSARAAFALAKGISHAPVLFPRLASQNEQSPVLLPPAPPPGSRFVPNSSSLDGKYLTGQNSFSAPGIYIYSLERLATPQEGRSSSRESR